MPHGSSHGTAGEAGRPKGRARGEGAAKRLDAPLPATYAASHMPRTRTSGCGTARIAPYAAFGCVVKSLNFRGGDAADVIAVSRTDGAEAVRI